MTGSIDSRAEILDRSDEIGRFRDRFHIPRDKNGGETVYLAGNSLGLQPKAVRDYVARELEKWATLGVNAHFEGDDPWMPYHELVRQSMANLVGCLQHEVVVMNSLTVNLHLMLATFYRPSGHKTRILIEEGAFPSDRYAAQSQLQYHGFDPERDLVEIGPRPGEHVIRTEDFVEAIERNERIALVVLGGVNYYSGQVLDMKTIVDAAHSRGIPVGFDLAHAVGNIPLRLHECSADFAVWCSYKYLNAGPGGIAGCFVHERHARDRSLPRFAGWWGHDPSSRFQMPHRFRPVDSADAWQVSNPPILLLAALRASLALFEEAGLEALYAKSRKLTDFARAALAEMQGPFRIITPAEPGTYGCQLSLRFDRDMPAIHAALEEDGVRCDTRDPDVIRIAPVPLYNTFADAARFAASLRKVLG